MSKTCKGHLVHHDDILANTSRFVTTCHACDRHHVFTCSGLMPESQDWARECFISCRCGAVLTVLDC